MHPTDPNFVQNATNSVCGDKSPTIYKVIPILLKLTKCVETNVNDPPPIARLKDVMRQELDSRTQDKDLALLGCLLNHTMKDLEFLLDSEQADGYALLLKVALGMADVKVNVKVKPETSDEQPSEILPPLPIVPSLLNIGDDNDKTVVMHSPPSKKAKVNVDMDEWLPDVVCIGES
ncbi:hypothetical protein CHS0354_011106 [Potamilus streckersoni]|uniref:Uncharacterized protein n=1 Tax=Potamilus streckersoni TaxID=2493646 RepID=A0AAE0TBZ5_9BIVA|nr:hypothetical protein CHS0354_011106 [Potamilus streckersoni]